MYNNLANKIYELREVFPWPKECEKSVYDPDGLAIAGSHKYLYDNNDLVHSPEHCLETMKRLSEYLTLKQQAFQEALKNLENNFPSVYYEFESDRLGFIQNNDKSTM